MIRIIHLKNMLAMIRIGVHPHEQGRLQRIRLNIWLSTPDEGEAERQQGIEDLNAVTDYQTVAEAIRRDLATGHIKLLESLAERVARCCLAASPGIEAVRVCAEKLEVFDDMESVGVEITRRRIESHPPDTPVLR